MYTAGTSARRSDTSPSHHQPPGLDCLVDDVKSEIRREMEQLNRRIDQIDKQLSMILQLLTAGGAPAAAQRHDGASAADKKVPPHAVQSPLFMDTIAEQDEDANSSMEAADDAGDGDKRRRMSADDKDSGQQSSAEAAQSSPSSSR